MLKTVLVLLVLTNLRILGTSRMTSCIRTVGAQGLLLGLLPLLSQGHGTWALAVAAVAAGVKGVLFPWLLLRALREARIRREVEPYVGFHASFLFGLASLAVGMALSARLPQPAGHAHPWLMPVAFATMLVGLFVLVARRKALTQALGYLVFENGIYAFGLAVSPEAPLVIELGILLDLLAAVFVMGITIFHINRTFDDIDTARLSSLHD